MYKFIELQCPYCDHRFVWEEHTRSGSRCKIYSRKGHKEHLISTVCPKCGLEMVVLKELHTGLAIDDESLEVVGISIGI